MKKGVKKAEGGAAAEESEGFDERLGRLEDIVGELEEGGVGLEAAIERYREGIGLLKGCREVLAGYRRQVEELAREAEEPVPYEDDPDAEA